MVSIYQNFEVEFGLSRDGVSWPLRVLQCAAGEARGSLRLHATPGEIAAKARSPSADFRLLGETLFNALFQDEVLGAYAQSRGIAELQGCFVRIKLRILDPQLAQIPWELLYDAHLQDFVALSIKSPIVRYIETPQPIKPLTVSSPLRILGFAVDTVGDLNLLREREYIQIALGSAINNRSIELGWVAGGRWEDLQNTLRRGPWHIFHFIGHGNFDQEFAESYMRLSGSGGGDVALTADQLGILLASHPSLRLIFLNSCLGATADPTNVYSSLATAAVRRGIPAAISMQFVIDDTAAAEFSRSFYEALAHGIELERAVTEARVTVRISFPHSTDWAAPVVHMRTHEGSLLPHSQHSPETVPAMEIRQMASTTHLTGQQTEILMNAMLDAFDRGSLARMVQFKLSTRLDAVAGGSNLSDTVFELIQWAQRSGRLRDLIQGALASQPDNPDLRSIAETVL